MAKVVSVEEAVSHIQNGNLLAVNGMMWVGGSKQFYRALEARFLETGSPKDLTLFSSCGIGHTMVWTTGSVCTRWPLHRRKPFLRQSWFRSNPADTFSFTISKRGFMHLKLDEDEENYSEFLESWRLQELVRKYSDYIRFPIRMNLAQLLSGRVQQVPAVQQHLTGIIRRAARQQTGHCHGGNGLARAGLPHQTQNFSVPDSEADAGDGLPLPAVEFDMEVPDFQHTTPLPCAADPRPKVPRRRSAGQ